MTDDGLSTLKDIERRVEAVLAAKPATKQPAPEASVEANSTEVAPDSVSAPGCEKDSAI
jgi:hypothetical protein